VPRFVGESYPVGISRDNLTAAIRRGRLVAAQMRGEGRQIQIVKSTLMPADDTLMCLFDATSAELVIELSRRAELPIERVVEAVELAADVELPSGAARHHRR
jgi:uncharacterized protein DUF4242